MKIPYSPVRGGKRYFQPTPAMRLKGFRPMPLGEDCTASRAQALHLYERWIDTFQASARFTFTDH